MAGSWRHMTTSEGKLRNNETFTGMIENLGDAYEAAEECYGMVWYLARQVAELTGPAEEDSLSALYRERLLKIIADAVKFHESGLRLGGVQRER